jgi:hypothetical protein
MSLIWSSARRRLRRVQVQGSLGLPVYRRKTWRPTRVRVRGKRERKRLGQGEKRRRRGGGGGGGRREEAGGRR